MSGTSLDGVDAALVEIDNHSQPSIRLLHLTTTAFPRVAPKNKTSL